MSTIETENMQEYDYIHECAKETAILKMFRVNRKSSISFFLRGKFFLFEMLAQSHHVSEMERN